MVRVTIDLLCRCTGHANKRKRDESQEQFLARITHLYCSDKGIEKIELLDRCRSLSVVYMYDNSIAKLEGFNSNTSLTHLYLQNNHIRKIENLGNLRYLTKLYLNHNTITVLEGLENLTQLVELHMAHQHLPEGEKLLIDPRSIKAISPTLTVLNLSGNMLDSLEDLLCLTELQQLLASNNNIMKMKKLSKVLSRFPNLWRLELSGNPISLQHKYRDRVVTMCYRLEMFDGREVSELERQFLFSWKAMRKARHRNQHKIVLEGDNVTAAEDTHAPPPIPPSMPPLPARTPIRLKQLIKRQTKKKEKPPEDNTTATNAISLHLPLIHKGGEFNMVASPYYSGSENSKPERMGYDAAYRMVTGVLDSSPLLNV